jgi:hypothetical protein
MTSSGPSWHKVVLNPRQVIWARTQTNMVLTSILLILLTKHTCYKSIIPTYSPSSLTLISSRDWDTLRQTSWITITEGAISCLALLLPTFTISSSPGKTVPSLSRARCHSTIKSCCSFLTAVYPSRFCKGTVEFHSCSCRICDMSPYMPWNVTVLWGNRSHQHLLSCT